MNNPPAFPTGTNTNSKGLTIEDSQGMTLRDYFAAAALNGMLGNYGCKTDPDKIIPAAYAYADAMLKVREQ